MAIMHLVLASIVAVVPQQDPRSDIVVVATSDIPQDARRVPDSELALMRGGMLLPNGLDVTVGIDIQTRVDGVLQLHTVYMSSGPAAGVHVYRDGTTVTPAPPGTVPVTTPIAASPGVIVDRSPTGTTVWNITQAPVTTVNVNESPSSTWPAVTGETAIPVSSDGTPVDQQSGRYTLLTNDHGTTARYDTGDISIQHLVGQATGAIVLNTANDRVIDTTSSVAVDLGNFPVAAVTGMLAVDTLALDAARGR